MTICDLPLSLFVLAPAERIFPRIRKKVRDVITDCQIMPKAARAAADREKEKRRREESGGILLPCAVPGTGSAVRTVHVPGTRTEGRKKRKLHMSQQREELSSSRRLYVHWAIIIDMRVWKFSFSLLLPMLLLLLLLKCSCVVVVVVRGVEKVIPLSKHFGSMSSFPIIALVRRPAGRGHTHAVSYKRCCVVSGDVP